VSKPPDIPGARASLQASLAAVAVDSSPTTADGPLTQLTAPQMVCSELEAFRRELTACGQQMLSAVPLRGVSFIEDSLRLLNRVACRIAVVGQVKAGKSSFVNALVQRPGLLPTDVNPWTTAITHLHFGRADAPANVAAEFTFFNPNEWEQLVHGAGHIRELTQRLVPGFEVELLKKHVDAMRRRSEERLGSALHDLLGKKHVFPSISSEVLERYVCSGAAGLLGTVVEQKGLYSDVVKSADVYFTSNDFGFPVTILDTPGTNDPFLVRDEITRRALETADIYIVLLTARQALSSADVALLRILRGLHKERIVVFINRIDELDDLVHDTPLVMQRVQAGLQREFPGSGIPIVAGSAIWALQSLGPSAAEPNPDLSDEIRAYAANVAEQGETSDLATLLVCSGLPTLSRVLADLTLRSHVGYVLKQIASSFSELVQVSRGAMAQEIENLATDVLSGTTRHQQGEEELRRINAEATEIERLITALQNLLLDLETQTTQVLETQCGAIGESLREAVESFAAMECDDMRQGGSRGRVWKCETTTLRQVLEERFVSFSREAEQEINKLEGHIFPKLRQVLQRHHPQWRQPAVEADKVPVELPSLSALSRVVALDLDEPWWKHWWISPRSEEERIFELDRLIKQEFDPIVDELVSAARMRLQTQQSSTLQKSTAVYMGLLEVLQEQNQSRQARIRVLTSAGDAIRKAELRRDGEARSTLLKRQVVVMEDLARKLNNIDQIWGARLT
jgi:signal recognition particle receptor subunit beta